MSATSTSVDLFIGDVITLHRVGVCSSDDIHSGLNGIHSHVSTQISAGVQQNQTIGRPTVWEK